MNPAVYIVDDEEYSINGLKALIARMPNLNLAGFDTDPLIVLNKIVSGTVKVDILFADIDMPDLNGLKLAELLGDRVLIIFVTGHSNYAVDAFGPSVIDFLTKPVNPEKFMRAVQRAIDRLSQKQIKTVTRPNSHIFLRISNRNIVKVKLADIVCVKGSDKYIEVFLNDAKPLLIKKTLSELLTVLPAEQFMRIHKSHIVNLDYVTGVVGNMVNLEKATSLEIGSTYMNAVYSRFDSV